MRALITGATGFIGSRLLAQVSDPVVLTRDPQRAMLRAGVTAHKWDPTAELPPAEAFDGVDVVFNLAGENVGDGRWSAAKKRRIRDSRVQGTANLVRAMAALEQRPRVLVSASAVGYYGSRGEEVLDESSSPGNDFLADVCREWEQAAAEAETLGVRVVFSRTGVALGEGGGALAKMLTPFRFGLGGRLGNGRQWMPWVHVDDVVGILLHAATDESLRGPVNAVSPEPATNREFTRELAHTLRRPAFLPMPALALRMVVGEFAEVLLASQRVMPRAAQSAGYKIQHPGLRGALAAAVAGRTAT